MVEITLPIVLQIVQTVGILVGIVYYITIMRNAQRTRELSLKVQEEAEKTRQRDLVFQRLQGYTLEYTKTFAEVASFTDWEDAEDFEKKYGIFANPEAFSKYLYIQRTFSLAGILLKENMADADLIFQLYPASAVIRIWEQFEPVIQNARKRRNYPTMNEPFEFLYNEVKKRYPEILPSDVWATE